MKMRLVDIKLVPIDPNGFGCTTLFPDTINFPMPKVKQPIGADEPDEGEEPDRPPLT